MKKVWIASLISALSFGCGPDQLDRVEVVRELSQSEVRDLKLRMRCHQIYLPGGTAVGQLSLEQSRRFRYCITRNAKLLGISPAGKVRVAPTEGNAYTVYRIPTTWKLPYEVVDSALVENDLNFPGE